MSGAYIGKVGAGFCGVWAGLVAFGRNLYQLGAFFHHFSTFLGAFGVILRRFWPKTAIAACFGRSPLSQHTLFSVKRSLKAFFVLPGHKLASRKHRPSWPDAAHRRNLSDPRVGTRGREQKRFISCPLHRSESRKVSLPCPSR